jgi:hypothetical protein
MMDSSTPTPFLGLGSTRTVVLPPIAALAWLTSHPIVAGVIRTLFVTQRAALSLVLGFPTLLAAHSVRVWVVATAMELATATTLAAANLASVMTIAPARFALPTLIPTPPVALSLPLAPALD